MANVYCRSAAAGAADGTTWANAYTTLAAAATGSTASDTLWVADDHAETAGATKTITFPTTPGLKVLCANTHVTEPPTGLATTATVTATGNFAVVFASGCAYVYGIIFNSGTGASGAADLIFGSVNTSNTDIIFDGCAFNIPSTSTAAPFVLGVGGTGSNVRVVTFVNCSFTQDSSAMSALFSTTSGTYIFRNITIGGVGATPPTSFIASAASGSSKIEIYDSDLSGRTFTSIVNVANWTGGHIPKVILKNCKLPAGVTVTTGTMPFVDALEIHMHNCDSADTHIRFSKNLWQGTITQQTSTRIRTSGATQADGTTYSMLMAGSANSSILLPLESPEIAIYNTSTGSSMTATVEILRDSATNLTDADIWLEIDYLGTSGFPQGSRGSDRVSSVIATAADQTSSSVTWDTTGMSNPNKQKLVVTFTPQEKGYVIGRVMLSANTSVYVDPLITLA